jgi:hypothetical protein
MVVQDKNNDENFSDNIPDGITDPYGWQSTQPDPWENYIFTLNDKKKSGNKSYYLWKNKIDNLNVILSSNGGVFKAERYSVEFPQNITSQNLNLQIKSTPIKKIDNSIVSIGSNLYIQAKDSVGNLITKYPKFFNVLVDFKVLDLSNFKTSTLSFYSSEDGIHWTKEPTEVDLSNKRAKTSIDHMSYFVFAGELLDTTPPTTMDSIVGMKGQESWYRSDVTINLESLDDYLGTDYTVYKMDDGEWQLYKSPLSAITEGHHILQYYSADKGENIEDIKTTEFNIDKTLPLAFITADPSVIWSPDNKMIPVNVFSSTSDDHLFATDWVVEDEYHKIEPKITSQNQNIELEASRDGRDMDGRMYIIKIIAQDLAGNITEQQVSIVVPHDQGLIK